jgi:hypothetical protein
MSKEANWMLEKTRNVQKEIEIIKAKRQEERQERMQKEKEYLGILESLQKQGMPKHGFHLNDITKGVVGEFSKIKEEFQEAEDAFEQGNKMLLLIELSDMVGAIERFLNKQIPGLQIEDLVAMAHATNRAFDSGIRK